LIARGNFDTDLLRPGEAIVRYGYTSDFSLATMFGVLDDGERARAEKYKRADDRTRYVTCRAILKLLLSKYVGIDVLDIKLQYSPNGKPTLPGMTSIQFNVSHSRDLLLWGISKGNIIGVDVEHMERKIPVSALALVCTEAELNKLHSVPSHLRNERFINCWTRKEALFKAAGTTGHQFEVSTENEKAFVLTTPDLAREKDQWHLHSYDLPGDYRGAVAIKGKISHLGVSRLDNAMIRHWQTRNAASFRHLNSIR